MSGKNILYLFSSGLDSALAWLPIAALACHALRAMLQLGKWTPLPHGMLM
jgi:hypothetical protein